VLVYKYNNIFQLSIVCEGMLCAEYKKITKIIVYLSLALGQKH
jgi:hypothetical protein